MHGSWQLWPSNHSCQEQGRVRSMRSDALSCKLLLPGVAPSIHGSGACRDSQLLAYIQMQVMADRFTQQKLHVWPMHLPTQVMESKAAAEETRQQRGRAVPPRL
ncbi:hypothetical protein SETIT_9G066000v2 [Setaria italica]|uniref:Uncharacterized protein n=2 Tax=Setaria TaxID=4554 RepID=A0A368SDS8_SETIT|nr:hypothetical protein SETIT_9G066000v2 [Setaria italica]TKV90994.1 hypothetical protein SEVIR_9G065400v2 [Setaria viridis]